MERDFLGLGSKLFPITLKETNTDLAHPSRGMKEWSLSSPKNGSFGASQQDRRSSFSVNNLSLSSGPFTSIPNTFEQYWRTHHNTSSQQLRMFPSSSQKEQTRGKSFINNSLGSSPIMAPPVSLFPATVGSRSYSKPPPPAQLTIFYGGSVSVYKDISPEKAQSIMLLAAKAQNLVPAITHPPTHMPPSFLPSSSYTVSETASGSNGFRATQTIATSLASTLQNNNQTNAYNNMAPKVSLPQARRASLARFLEKRKERLINVSPYHVDKKPSEDRRTSTSECVSSSLSSASTLRRPI